jgi:hypothetical protein
MDAQGRITHRMTIHAFIFECSSTTYLDCVEKNLFGSNKPWPLQIKAGDYCLLHHYEIGGLLGLWQATCNGGKGLVPKMWSGKFPYQVKVKLVLPKITEVPKHLLAQLGVNPAVGRCDNCLDEDLAEELIRGMLTPGNRS